MPFLLMPAHLAALTAFQLALALAFVDPRWSVLPLAAFVLLCLLAPIFPRLSFYLPIISRGPRGARGVALTFDDGPDPRVTPQVLDLLDRHRVKAAFFLVGAKAERHPELVRAILERGHTLGNHSHTHPPFLMLQGRRAIAREVAAAQAALAPLGIAPLAFRPPVGITNPDLWPVLAAQGMVCVNFSCRAADMGNRRVAGLAGKILRKVRPRDIVLLHDTAPHRVPVEQLLAELEALLAGLAQRELPVQPLPELLGRQLMAPASGPVPGLGQAFYDGLATRYDQEQFGTGVARARRAELALYQARAAQLFEGRKRVLEIGAGTGIFTLDLARRCREVVALDISPAMLEQLRHKAGAAGIGNLVPVLGDAAALDLPGRFDAACAFSSLEYLSDLQGFLDRLAGQLEPGAPVYFTTARTSLFRLFTQMGNAMRQGVWLKSRTRGQMRAMLERSGFERVEIGTHLLKAGPWGGMLLEVLAWKRG
jgi:peptidoglycan/xylan/chitin deacetylase (PgdA/CDA1 family)/SAM-dependent methyltransferase